MKICIDASFLMLNKASGIKSYTHTLIHDLLDSDRENEYLLFYNYFLNRQRLRIPEWGYDQVKNIVCRMPRRLLFYTFYKNFNFPKIERFTGDIDIFHSLHTYSPPVRKAKTILTINDLREFYFPEEYKREDEDTKLRIKSLERTNCVISISENTKKDIIHFLNFPEEKIEVVYYDLDAKFKTVHNDQITAVRKKFGIDKEFILYVGNHEPRKNIGGLLQSYFLLKEKFKAPHALVMAGGVPEKGSTVQALISKSPHKEDIVFIPALLGPDLVAMYNGASCFFFPSFYEGFGLPPLEAMACGCPVVASNTSSIPEVAGDAGILVNPKDREACAEALWAVISDEAKRKVLIKKGLQRAKAFKNKTMAKKTLDVYKRVRYG